MPENHDKPDVDCAELSRRLLIDPFDPDAALLRHRTRCARCDRAARKALAFEMALRQALAVDPPPGLGTRIGAARRRHATRRLAAAAGLAVSLGLAGWLGYGLRGWLEPAPTLAQLVREHIEREAPHLGERGNLTDAQVAAVLHQVGGELVVSLGRVDFAGLCPMRRALSAHLVIEGARGPVTLLFMPGEHLDGPQPVRSEALQGLVVPTAYGSLAVVGGRGEPVERLIKRIGDSVTWSS